MRTATAIGPAPRSFRYVARAIRAPSQVGSFPMPELAAVVAFAAVGLASAFVPTGNELVRFVVAAVLGSALASEAFLACSAAFELIGLATGLVAPF